MKLQRILEISNTPEDISLCPLQYEVYRKYLWLNNTWFIVNAFFFDLSDVRATL